MNEYPCELTGGCQCGAVPRRVLTWTRREPARFRSSKKVDRGFCSACGTPLFYDDVTGARINLSIGSLDDPAAFKPLGQCGTEARMPWFGELGAVPDTGETEHSEQAG